MFRGFSSQSKLTILTFSFVSLLLSACNSGLNNEFAVTHGLKDVKSLESENGGCRPEVENLDAKDGIDFVSGGKTCFVTQVFYSPLLKSGEQADLEIIYLHGDGGSSKYARPVPRLRRYLSQTVLLHHLFRSNKIKVRIVARPSYGFEGVGNTTGSRRAYGTNRYTKTAANSTALMLQKLHKESSAKSFVVSGGSGGAQDIAGAITEFGDLLPLSLDTAILKAAWGSISVAKVRYGFSFENAVVPEKYVSNIPAFLNVHIVNSRGDKTTGFSGSNDLHEKIKQSGKKNVWLYTYENFSHQGLRTEPDVLNDNIYPVIRRILKLKSAF